MAKLTAKERAGAQAVNCAPLGAAVSSTGALGRSAPRASPPTLAARGVRWLMARDDSIRIESRSMAELAALRARVSRSSGDAACRGATGGWWSSCPACSATTSTCARSATGCDAWAIARRARRCRSTPAARTACWRPVEQGVQRHLDASARSGRPDRARPRRDALLGVRATPRRTRVAPRPRRLTGAGRRHDVPPSRARSPLPAWRTPASPPPGNRRCACSTPTAPCRPVGASTSRTSSVRWRRRRRCCRSPARDDPIVPTHASELRAGENVVVGGSHSGLAHNKAVFKHLGRFLAE